MAKIRALTCAIMANLLEYAREDSDDFSYRACSALPKSITLWLCGSIQGLRDLSGRMSTS
ncbi:hypothetical protein CHELA1G11_12588 [Hyphomicrobiales bacterium]|nr:hypothetical protein CHELA1G2_11719 [Hyphomicrobiales bacterium]CAH1665780.1 hypothetical protein CHELA1G11_12588 [Hyphomicrobiales bacterium]